MIRHILENFNIDSFSFVPASSLETANERLRASLPDGGNVIFMLIPYYRGDCNGKISAYGAVFDYHGYAKMLTESVCEYIREHYEEAALGFCDHSPFAECEGAALAGLGIIGDNSLLITEKYSSYVFICEVYTTLSPEALAAEGVPLGAMTIGRCEGCGECKKACPAGIADERERTRCISSLTQKKGELSEEEISLIKKGESIWGCDRCQAACPHTKKALKEGTIYSPIPYFTDSYIEGDPGEAIEGMDEKTFSLYPFAWRKRATITRNIRLLKAEADGK